MGSWTFWTYLPSAPSTQIEGLPEASWQSQILSFPPADHQGGQVYSIPLAGAICSEMRGTQALLKSFFGASYRFQEEFQHPGVC